MMVGASLRAFSSCKKGLMGRAKFGIRKGQVAFLAALCVGDAGKMRVEVYGPVIAEALGKGVQQGGVVRGGGGPGKLHALTAGVQVPGNQCRG